MTTTHVVLIAAAVCWMMILSLIAIAAVTLKLAERANRRETARIAARHARARADAS